MLYSIFNFQKRALLFAAIILGLAVSISLSVFVVTFQNFSPIGLSLLIISLFVFFCILNYCLLDKTLNKISNYSLPIKLLWICLCVLIGISLVFVLPISKTSPSYHTLKIVATGQHNPKTMSSEVWLYSIRTKDGLKLNRTILAISNGWEYRDGTLFSYQKQPAVIEYYGPIGGDLTLNFASYAQAGKVQIVFDGITTVKDLYSATSTSKSIFLPIVSSPLLSALIFVADILALSFLVFLASILALLGPAERLEPAPNRRQVRDMIAPETAFLVLAILFGLSFALVTPPFQVADEDAHFGYAYAVSIGKLRGYISVIPRSIGDLKVVTDRLPFHPEEKIAYGTLIKFVNVPLELQSLQASNYQGVAKVDPVPYFPVAISLAIAKLLNLNPFAFFFFGRIFQLFIWILISYSALKLLPEFKWAFLLLILSPMSLSIAASYSGDAITNSVSFLWFGLCLNYSSLRQNGLSSKSKKLLILVAAFLSLTKLPYFLLLGLFFLIPPMNFGSKRQYQRTVALLFGISFILILFSLSYLKNVGYLKNDVPLANSTASANFTNQIYYLLNNPLEFPRIMARSLKLLGIFYFDSYIGRLGWLDTVLPQYVYATYPLIFLLVVLIDQKNCFVFTPGQRLVSFLTGVAVFSAIFFSLYLTWTPVGAKILEGMQGRYLIPLGPIFISLFINKTFSKPTSWKGVLVIAYVFIVLSITVRTLILRYYII